MTREEILNILKQRKIKHVRLQFLDKNGNTKSIMVPIASMEVVLNNQLTYLELSTDGINRIKETELYLVPNLDTYKELDFNETKLLGSAGFLCDTRLETGEFVSRFPINNVEINSDNNGNNDNNYDRILEGDYDD